MNNLLNKTTVSALILSGILIAPNTFAISTQTAITAKAGLDSNPHRLNTQFNINESSYNYYRLNTKLKFSKRIHLSATADYWDHDQNLADNHILTAKLQYKAGNFFKQRGLSINYKQKDKTYVSRLQGTTAIFAGEDLDDRYDYQHFTLNAYRNFKLFKRTYNQIELDINKKDYTDYSDPDITNFDYASFKITDKLIIKANKKTTHGLNLSYESRFFTDREQKDSTGNKIVGTEMIFNYFNVGYNYQKKINKRIQLKFNTRYTQRADNGSGYYDSTKLSAGLKAQVKWHKLSKLELNYKISDFSYVREPEVSPLLNEEEFTSELKHEVSISSTTRLPKRWLKQASIEIDYTFTEADSNRSQYQYNRQLISAGFKLSF